MRRIFFTVCLSCSFAGLMAQCEIQSKLRPDGTMYYHAPLTLLYQTSEMELKGNLVTDKEHYFLSLSPKPYQYKKQKKTVSKDLMVTLENDSSYALKYYDSWYGKDSAFNLLYLFDKKQLNSFLNNNIQSFHLKVGEIERTFIFKLHPDIIKEQFACFKTPATKL